MNADLTKFLVTRTKTPFAWGFDDCSLLIADWWRANHGTDPAAHLRGTYSTALEKDRIVKEAGGLVALVSGIAGQAGATETDSPARGDFAVIEVPGHRYPLAAIYSGGKFWAVRTEEGIGFPPSVKILKAWQI